MAGAGAEIIDKGGTEKEREPKINNFGSATLQLFIALPTTFESTLLIFRSRSWIYKKNRFRLDNPIQEYEHLNGGHADLTESQQYRHQQPTTPVPNGQQNLRGRLHTLQQDAGHRTLGHRGALLQVLEDQLAARRADHLPLVGLGVVGQPTAIGDTLHHFQA